MGERLARWDAPRLLEIALGERHAPALPAGTQPGLDLWIDADRLTEGARDRFAGQVIGGRAEAAGADDEIVTFEGRDECLRDDIEAIGECLHPAHGDALLRERTSKLARVRVAGLTDQQLGADAEDRRRSE